MSIPKFKPAKHYLGEYNILCRLAKVKNSQLPGIATRAIVRSKEDPVCQIYLHGKGGKDFSAWEKGILEQLFDGQSLAALVDSAMKGYAKDPSGYTSAKPAEREEIQKIGIAPFMTIYRIVIDDSRKEVILSARTELDLHLIEHGISIYLEKGKWHFSDAEYYINYVAELGPTLEEAEEAEEEKRQWSALFPRVKSGTPIETDPAILYGRWELDKVKTKEAFLALGCSTIIGVIELWSDQVMEFTPKVYTYYNSGQVGAVYEFLGCERKGNRITVRRQDATGHLRRGPMRR